MRIFPIACLVAGLSSAPALAQIESPQVESLQQSVVTSAPYLIAHPGEAARMEGLRALKAGDADQARRRFLTGARYADKMSAFMLGQLYWEGIGGEVDRPLAYAWMDLAAERGNQAALARREFFWSSLDADQRAQALEVGKPLYARYGDAAAQPRLEAVMRRTRKNVTGSMLGWVGTVSECLAEEHKGMKRGPLGTCPPTVPGNQYYADNLWEPQTYWARQDASMTRELGSKIEVGPLNSLPAR